MLFKNFAIFLKGGLKSKNVYLYAKLFSNYLIQDKQACTSIYLMRDFTMQLKMKAFE